MFDDQHQSVRIGVGFNLYKKIIMPSYTVKFRRKHQLEIKRDSHTITDAELVELGELVKYFDKFLHRISPSENYKPF